MNSIKPSATLIIGAKAKEMKNKGIKAVDLSAGEPDFHTPNHIKNAGIEAINNNQTYYTAVAGIAPLRDAISNYLFRKNGVRFAQNEIVVSVGAKQAIFNAIMSIINPGDEVIIPAPCWVSYAEMVSIADGKSVIIPPEKEERFKLLPSALQNAITPQTKCLILNSPNNPTGVVYNKDELHAIGNILKEHPEIMVISDEIYTEIFFGQDKVHTLLELFPDMKDRIIVINGVSKAYSMTGWRIGYVACNNAVANAISTLQSQSTSSASTMSQYAALAALNGDQSCIKDYVKSFKARQQKAENILSKSPLLDVYIGEGTFYLFVGCEKVIGMTTPKGKVISNSIDFSQYLLEDYLVATVPGEAFCANGFFRISYAISAEELVKGCNNIVEACNALVMN